MEKIFNSKWIKSKKNNKDAATDFYRSFSVKDGVKKAELLVTAHGVFVAWLNSKRIGEDILMPGWTSYAKRLQVLSYDVTDMLNSGENELKIGVGKGWFFHKKEDWKGKDLKSDETALICALNITYNNGSEETVISDGSWQTAKSNVIYNDMYNGETLDLTAKVNRREPACEIDYSKDMLIPYEGEPVREQERLCVKEVITTPKGEKVLDFGQELTGYVEFTANAPKGTKTVLQHFEVLDRDGNVYTENLRDAKEQLCVISDGEPFTYKPLYTFYGFRYVQVIGLDSFKPEDFTAIVVHSEMKRMGYFECSNELLNKFAHNVIWGQKGNFLDVPTDCPQRNERLGWTGDAEMFCRTAAINYDVRRFFDKWYNDIAADQCEDGMIPHVIPNACGVFNISSGSPAWDDVATVLPWELYIAYGDKKRLERQYPTMKKYVDGMLKKCRKKDAPPEEEYARPWTTEGYGDWLSLEDLSREHGVGETDRGLIATAYLAYGLKVLIKASAILGYNACEYKDILERVVKFFRSEYMENGRMKQELQTPAVLAIEFGLTDNLAETGKQLAEDVRKLGRLTTGFIGATHILDALSAVGEDELAVDLLLRTEYPSWLYAVTMGATTVWERWNGMYPDGHFADPGMNSFNHYAYGSVLSWMFRRLAGITPVEEEPGYKKILFAPYSDKRIPCVKASIETVHGKAESNCEMTENGWKYEFTVPTGCKAEAVISGKTYPLKDGINIITVESC